MIELTQDEQSIFQAILSANEAMGLGLTFRAAGGWVRDKLLRTPSDDIDIAIDSMTGERFSAKFMEHCRLSGQKLGRCYVVAANPDKSKHLETVGIEILGRKIDFVNLRSEEYGESRIPSMKMGSPIEDAKRRDLSVNSLFYNLNTGEVEDYVGGIEDLKQMILRTPLEPKKTFLDDPLRVCRLLRFFSRWSNATIDPAAVLAMSDPEVHEAFRNKVSHERLGPELVKLLAGRRPAEALRKIFETGFDKALFAGWPDVRIDQRNRHHAFGLVEHTLRVVENMANLTFGLPEAHRVRMLFAALFHDVGKAAPGIAKENAVGDMSYVGHEDASAVIADEYLTKIGIQKADRDFICAIVKLHMRAHVPSWSNRAIGKMIRDSDVPGLGPLWRDVFVHGIADTRAKGTGNPDEEEDAINDTIRLFENFKLKIGKDVPKPLLNGHDLMLMFPSIKPNRLAKIDGHEHPINFIRYVSDILLDEEADGTITDKDSAALLVGSMRKQIETTFSL